MFLFIPILIGIEFLNLQEFQILQNLIGINRNDYPDIIDNC